MTLINIDRKDMINLYECGYVPSSRLAEIGFGRCERKLMRLGFKRVGADNLTLDYERENIRYNITQQLEIIMKPGGVYVISCEKNCNSDGYSNAIALSPYEMQLAMKIAKKFQRAVKKHGGQ